MFIYGCESHASNVEQGFKERVFPMMMSKNCEDKVGLKELGSCLNSFISKYTRLHLVLYLSFCSFVSNDANLKYRRAR